MIENELPYVNKKELIKLVATLYLTVRVERLPEKNKRSVHRKSRLCVSPWYIKIEDPVIQIRAYLLNDVIHYTLPLNAANQDGRLNLVVNAEVTEWVLG